MNSRIRELRKTLKLNQREFAEKIGLKQNAISYMEKSGGTVTEQNIKTICSQFNVNENWLRAGNGKMFIENEKKQKELFNIFNKLSPELQDYLIKIAKELLETQRKMQTSSNITTNTVDNVDKAVDKSLEITSAEPINKKSYDELSKEEKAKLFYEELDLEEKAKEKSEVSQKNALKSS